MAKKDSRVVGMLMVGLVGVLALALIALGVLQVRSGHGGNGYVNVFGQDDLPAFMIDTGVLLLLVPLIGLVSWARKRLLLRQLRRQYGRPR
jgi:hypothetical protein